MSEQHTFTCDHCGSTGHAFCDGRGPAQAPSGWIQDGNRDYCSEECREEATRP